MEQGSSQAHTRLMQEILLALSKQNLCRVWRNECGMALNIRTKRPFKYGLIGSPDIIGFTCKGQFLGIECKTANAIQSQNQRNFNAIANKFNASYFVARDVASALAFVLSLCSEG